jgi:hypothetical protein
MPKKKSARDLVAALATKGNASEYHSCHTCRLKNLSDINEVLRAFDDGVEDGSIKFGLRTIWEKILVVDFEYPYQAGALKGHHTKGHHLDKET